MFSTHTHTHTLSLSLPASIRRGVNRKACSWSAFQMPCPTSDSPPVLLLGLRSPVVIASVPLPKPPSARPCKFAAHSVFDSGGTGFGCMAALEREGGISPKHSIYAGVCVCRRQEETSLGADWSRRLAKDPRWPGWTTRLAGSIKPYRTHGRPTSARAAADVPCA